MLIEQRGAAHVEVVVVINEETGAFLDGSKDRFNEVGREGWAAKAPAEPAGPADKSFGGIGGPVHDDLAFLCVVVKPFLHSVEDEG